MKRYSDIIFLLSGPLACLLLLALPVPEGLTPLGMKSMAAALWIVIWWSTQVLPLAAVSLLSILIFALVGVLPPLAGFATLGNGNIMLMLGAMLILGVWKESNLITRYAYWALTLPVVGGSSVRLMLMFALSTGVVSMIVPNIPVAVLFVSIAVAIGRGLEVPIGNNLIKSLCVMSGVGSALGGSGTPIGGAPNLVVIAGIAAALKYDVQFMEWTALGFPLSIVMLLAMWGLAVLFFPPLRTIAMSGSSDYLQRKYAELGPVTRYEHMAVAVMAMAMLLWAVGAPLARWLGLDMLLKMKMFAPGSVALLMGTSLLLLPLRRDPESGKITFALSWDQAVKSVDWSVLIFLLGAILFGNVLVQAGLDKWIAGGVRTLLGDMPPMAVWFSIMIMGALISQIIPNLAVVGIFIPITANVAASYGLNPLTTCLTVGMIANIGIVFPFSSVPIAVSMMGAEGYASQKDFILFGLAILVVCSLLAMVMGYAVGDFIFPQFVPAAGG